MFANAYKVARQFTWPLIVSTRRFDGTVESGCAAFVVLNEEGWILTAAHLWGLYSAYENHKKEIAAYEEQLKAIQQDSNLDSKRRHKKLKRLKPNPKWITNHSFWWGRDGVKLKDGMILGEVDLAVGRLEPFDPKIIQTYSTIKNPETLDPGTSLCKLGYPFHKIKTTFDDEKQSFILAPGAVPLPFFPIEGIYTRNAVAGKTKDGKYPVKFLETSSPGLRGQSGGPIFDVKGTVWAIQSHTAHLQLGFSPTIEKEGKKVEEHQFLNVGLGVHPEVIVAFLKDNSVKFKLSDY